MCGFLYNYKCRYTHLCEYVYLAGTGTISCMGLPYTCMQFSLLLLLVLLQHIARLHALQKLVGKSTVSLRMSIAKRFIESKRQHRCILFETRVFHPIYLKQFMTTYSTELLDFTLRVSIVVVYLIWVLRTCHFALFISYSLVTWSRVTVSFFHQKISPDNEKVMYNDRSLSTSKF